MRLYIKGNFNKKNRLAYRDLAEKMWFDEKNGKELEISHAGNDETLQEDYSLSLANDKWLNDYRWNKVGKTLTDFSQKHDHITMEFEDTQVTDYHSKREFLMITTEFLETLTVDKRAMYIMAIEVANAVNGPISEDDKETWLGTEAFEGMHEKTLSLTYDEANELSLVEIKTIKAVDELYYQQFDND
ncbi:MULTISPECIES: hypothetical protein [unclassified Lactococcus]|uniref:hypothetical protein n=1 Tax=unclassified Lactococcus TaxID=2643510 RepID=UPI0011C749C0|nr:MULTISPECIES: hypothetical protein [unclassified Lactococcus]MQW23184.1 hypothetical protein [Lactococcus sp. dk101]TXK44234.1 hypothetical protein FVP42_06185 [Lactococcus sp. dk310]TXK49965.1 hypothetical protein FVP43_06155 [Lactococcus sp. dk322]